MKAFDGSEASPTLPKVSSGGGALLYLIPQAGILTVVKYALR